MDRIGLLFLANWLPVGGFETHLLSIVKRLDRKSFHPVLCCLKEGGPMEQEFRATGIPVHTRLQSHRLDPIGIARLVQIMKREGIAVLDTDFQRNTVFIGTVASILAGVPVVLASLHSTAHMHRERIVEWPARICLGRVDRVVALANCHRDMLIEKERVNADQIVVCPNAVDVNAFRPSSPSQELRTELNIPEGTPVVAIIASLQPDKGHGVFLKAARRIVERHPETRLLVIGEGPERENLEAMMRDLRLEEQVRFLGRRRDLPDLHQLIDITVLSSYPFRETFPLAILEAMACGNPAVSTRVGALEDIVAEGETGYLVDIGDDDALAAAVVRLLDDPELRKRMGAAARRRVEQLFSIDKTVPDREMMYRQLLEEKRGRRSPTPG